MLSILFSEHKNCCIKKNIWWHECLIRSLWMLPLEMMTLRNSHKIYIERPTRLKRYKMYF